ncbi:MAG TPA: hypothetical protein VGZ47_10160 [Gemmataceae bacterium]|nr:hypothetical protein [Gemmataceae bacterium]
MSRFRIVVVLLLGTTLLSSCKKVADEKKVDVAPGDIKIFSVPAVKSLSVEFAATPDPVNVYVVAGKDADKAQTDLQNGKEPASPLAAQKASSGTISVSSSEKTEMTILVTSSKKTSVTVKFNGS